jgi:hypothetical protein
MVKCVRVKGSSIETDTPALWNLIGCGVTPSPLPVYISAQRYSSATFVSLRFHSRKNRRAFKKYYYIKFHFFKKNLILKLPNLKLVESVAFCPVLV